MKEAAVAINEIQEQLEDEVRISPALWRQKRAKNRRPGGKSWQGERWQD
jgi:hypothetical protein